MGARTAWACGAVVAVGLAGRLRLLLAGPSFWYDEAYLLRNVRQKGYAELLGPLADQQAAPPAFLWALRALSDLFGTAEWAVRLPAAVAGGLTVVLLAPLARRLVGHPGYLWAVAFAAVSLHGLTLGNDVKPYTTDALVTVLVLLAGTAYFAENGRGRPAGLLALAAVGPWLSYAAVFPLAGAGAAWFVDAARRRERAGWLGLLAYAAVGLASCGLLWHLAVRHQRTPYLLTYWQSGFVDRSGPLAAAGSAVTLLRRAGDYVSTGLGYPFLVLVPAGWAVIGRRNPARAVLLMGTLAAAVAAAAARVYPLDDRLTLFAAPVYWLSAAAAVGAVVRRLPVPGGRPVLVALLLLPAADLARFVPTAWRGGHGPQFREAFEYVNARRQPDDLIWQAYPEVYEVYHGPDRTGFDARVPFDRCVAESRGRRLWLIAPPGGVSAGGAAAGGLSLDRLHLALEADGRVLAQEHTVRGLTVWRYDPGPR